jgi:hypothetical protein
MAVTLKTSNGANSFNVVPPARTRPSAWAKPPATTGPAPCPWTATNGCGSTGCAVPPAATRRRTTR